MKVITVNRKAFHNYEIKEKFEAGIVLTGDEVKSLRQGNVSLTDAFAIIHEGELNLLNCYIAPYSHAYSKKENSRRTRKLLMHKREMNKLVGEISRKGLTLIPLKMYFNDRGYIKIELALAKHKKAASKKRELREKDIKREAQREVKYRI
ncbi:SsrA-binding protein SmpB [Candidatus Dependentiae bacterium]|nr:SsrA-binding protein SmpB [Candidatus Dependentiae bacterium]